MVAFTSKEAKTIIGEGHVSKREPSPYLHHFSITCNDINTFERFHCDALGLRTVIDRRPGENIFMVDPDVATNGDRTGPMVEVIDPSCMGEREEMIINSYGPCIDHISYLVDDVDITLASFDSQGVEITMELIDYGAIQSCQPGQQLYRQWSQAHCRKPIKEFT